MCQGLNASKEVFGACGGIPLIIPYLSYDSPNGEEKDAVLISAIECIWSSVCGIQKNEDIFFELEGIYVLLDLLESTSCNIKGHIMGCVLDLLENPKFIYLVFKWRTKHDVSKGIIQLLICLWDDEEKRQSGN